VKRLLLALWCCLLLSGSALAHELRPAYLQIEQDADGSALVVWKQPAQGDMALRLRPKLSNGWLDRDPDGLQPSGSHVVRTWRIPRSDGLAGVRLDVEGLGDSLTDVMVKWRRPDKPDFTALVRAGDPALLFPESADASGGGFLALGFEHILTGPDHLLFVFGLLLLVPGRRQLVMTVTAFTAAHSAALAAATLGRMPLSIPVVETMVSLSLLLLAVEVVRARRGEGGLTNSRPWVAAFAFGLLHGCAFAGELALLELGRMEQAIALVLFNLGVEAGQLAFLAIVLVAWHCLRRLPVHWPAMARAMPLYALGGLGAFWTLQNAWNLFASH
jgi:hydrogenase/urease accessory protein HupE